MEINRRNDSVKFGKGHKRKYYSQNGVVTLIEDISMSNRSAIASTFVEEKSDEIATVLSLLRQPIVAGCIVTVNAIGSEKEITQQIIAQNSEYVLALRKDQEVLYEKVQKIFTLALVNNFAQVKHQFHQIIQRNVDALETRQYWIIDDPGYVQYIDPKGDWKGLRSIGMFQLIRQTDSITVHEACYYLLSFANDAKKFAEAIRTPAGVLKLVFI